MTRPGTPDETQRLLDEVFDDEGRSRAPARLLEDTFVRTQTTRQSRRRPWDAIRTPSIGSGPAPLVVVALLVAGALVVASGAGSRFLAPPPSAVSPPPQASPAIVTCANGGPLGGDP